MPTAGTNGIIEITTHLLRTDLPRDWNTCTLSVNSGSTAPTTANWQALTDAIRSVWFATTGTWSKFGSCDGTVTAYNRADATPRPEKAMSVYTAGSPLASVNGPREVSLCLSYFAGRNLPRQRGRIYLPVTAFTVGSDVPSHATVDAVVGLGTQLNTTITALTPSWSITVHSKVLNQDSVVDHFFCNDAWDTQRRRGLRETYRKTVTFP
jgi:hypothetical protein